MLVGIPRILGGIGRWLSVLKWDLSGKPTKENHPKVVLVFHGGSRRNWPDPRMSDPEGISDYGLYYSSAWFFSFADDPSSCLHVHQDDKTHGHWLRNPFDER